MKNRILIPAMAVLLMGSIVFNSCESDAQKAEKANDAVVTEKAELKDAQNVAENAEQNAVNEEAWKLYKADTYAKIKSNEEAILMLRTARAKTDKNVDKIYKQGIDDLEKKNMGLKTKMDAYTLGQTNWESFKSELNRDMDELGAALKNLTVDNKK